MPFFSRSSDVSEKLSSLITHKNENEKMRAPYLSHHSCGRSIGLFSLYLKLYLNVCSNNQGPSNQDLIDTAVRQELGFRPTYGLLYLTHTKFYLNLAEYKASTEAKDSNLIRHDYKNITCGIRQLVPDISLTAKTCQLSPHFRGIRRELGWQKV